MRLNLRSKSIVPFAQVLVGGINGSADVSVSAAIPGIPPIAFDADYLHAFEDDGGANIVRFQVGVVFARQAGRRSGRDGRARRTL